MLNNLAGDYVDGAKTLTLGVKSKLKYTLSVEFEAGAEYLTEIKVKDELMTLTAENTYTSGYEYEDQYLNLKISSVNADKFTIEVYGVKSFSGGTIDENIYLFDNIALKAKIVKNTFALTVEEKLFDDIVELNTNNPQTLTTGNLINASVTGSSLIDGTRFEYNSQTQVAFKNTDGEGDNKKQLTQIAFKDENLSFTFDVDFASTENLIERFQVKDKNNQAVSSGIAASQNGNVVTLKVELDGQTFSYSFELVASNNSIQFNFVGVGNCNLTLIYTAIKLIKVS